MRATVIGFGCRLNQSESDAIGAALREQGWAIGASDELDWVIVNTCTITHAADADARAAIRRAHREHPRARIAVTGCWAESEPQQAAALPGVALVVGNASKHSLPSLLGGAQLVQVGRLRERAPLRPLPPAIDARARALLQVQDGCDYRCSFCIVPSVRGRSRSLPTREVLARVRTLVDAGVAELVTTGVHLGTWGRDLGERGGITELVARIVPLLGEARLRLSSIDPHEVDDELLALMAAHPRAICRHLHLPVQSCDDGVLRRMRRAHDAASFVALVERATARMPGLAISSDVIVGHPGEDDDAFARTHDVLARLPIAYLHVFPYSRRRGTAAIAMPDHVPPQVIAARSRSLRALSQRKADAFRTRHGGGELDLVVHRHADARGRWWARSDNDLRFELHDAAGVAGRRVRAHADPDGVTARFV
ncbi:MAG TPA: tRNA (N(6)-L-threonylcarbamoyladenosine(37)-C(2))-methylthiotransferase MtaB [Nannocystaceae bacterium]|nr:tRNA (N(6)-L-threonylcarbamoyladenosine(37)-C(2))-methylthiotransferase MtaB [Nannocystaceae bacterium]